MSETQQSKNMSGAEHFSFSKTPHEETGVMLATMYDSRTGYTVRCVVPNDGVRSASLMAFAGARYSRSGDSVDSILRDVVQSGVSADEKLASIFRGYGHASVAEMAPVMMYLEGVPLISAARFFYNSAVHAGQERSTRYQNFGTAQPIELADYVEQGVPGSTFKHASTLFHILQEISLRNYNKYEALLKDKYIEVYEVDNTKKAQVGALQARVFDSARYHLLFGTYSRTSLAFLTSAREWARMIGFYKASDDKKMQMLAEQIETLLAPPKEFAKSVGYTPEVAELLRHTDVDSTTEQTLKNLQIFLDKEGFESMVISLSHGSVIPEVSLIDKEFLPEEIVVAQHIMSLYPATEIYSVLKWIRNLPEEKLIELCSSIFSEFNHHKQMGNEASSGAYSFLLEHADIGVVRDLMRHRAWGRWNNVMSARTRYETLIRRGYSLPSYLTDNPKLHIEREMFEHDIAEYYKNLQGFIEVVGGEDWFPKHLLTELLPIGHASTTLMHAGAKETSYLTSLRVRPGGHINYRKLTFEMAEKLAQRSPVLRALALSELQRPDASSRDQFLDRS